MNKLILGLFIGICFLTFAQNTDEQLANHYFSEGDCEKAIPYFEKSYTAQPSEYLYKRYLSCLRETKDEKGTIKLIQKQISSFPNVPQYEIDLAQEYENQGNDKKAEKQYTALLDKISPNPRYIIDLQRALSSIGKNDLALQVLQKGEQLLKGSYSLGLQLAEVYGALNENEKMIAEYFFYF